MTVSVTRPTTLNQLVQLLTLKRKKRLLTYVQIFMNNDNVNSETLFLIKKNSQELQDVGFVMVMIALIV